MAIKKVLIIDDERLLRSTTRLLLQKQGIEAVVAENGQEGIRAAERESPDMILLDIMMPEMNGWEVLRRLKENTVTSSIPVVIFTAADFDTHDAAFKQQGAVAVLRKPFHLNELLTVMGLGMREE